MFESLPTFTQTKEHTQYFRITPLLIIDEQKVLGMFFCSGGEGGIRTLGTFRYTRFPSVLDRPL